MKKRERYHCLDTLRGFTLLSMILYHFIWDLVYVRELEIAWFHSELAYIWQQSICWTFILLSGFCWDLGRKKFLHGSIIFFAGILVSIVTELFLPQHRILFGVLTLLGTSMLLMIPLNRILHRIPPFLGTGFSLILFTITKSINKGYIGLGKNLTLNLPTEWYDKGYFLTFLGFTNKHFSSSDYFSLFPWFFLFLSGYFLYRIVFEKGITHQLKNCETSNTLFDFLGRHSLILYLIHQPLLYLILQLC